MVGGGKSRPHFKFKFQKSKNNIFGWVISIKRLARSFGIDKKRLLLISKAFPKLGVVLTFIKDISYYYFNNFFIRWLNIFEDFSEF